MLSILVNILLYVVVIGVLVFVHELGHFLAAKSVKAKIYEFSLGFGPKIFSKKRKGIQYSIRAIPLGGYVKIAGDGDPSGGEDKKELEDPNSLKKKSKLAQMWVMLAGVIMNLLLATGIYYVALSQNDWCVSLNPEFKEFEPVVGKLGYERLGDVEYVGIVEGSGLDIAGVPDEGIIESINGKDIKYTFDISDVVEGMEGETVEVIVCAEKDSCKEYFVVVSQDGSLGFEMYSNYVVNISYADNKIASGPGHLANMVKLVYEKLTSLFAEAKETGDYTEVSNSFTGPVGIYVVLDYFKQFGFLTVLALIADMSLSLAIMNILPIPALDGGRVLILIIESIIRKDLDEKVEAAIINVSFILLMIFTIFICVKDIFTIDSIKSMFG